MIDLVKNIFHVLRHVRSAIRNMWRNGVMTFSAIFAVTITLMLIMVLCVIGYNVENITRNVEENLTIYVKVDRNASDAQSTSVGTAIKEIDGVSTVTFSSKEEELEKLIASQDEDNKALFESYRKDNPLGDAYVVEVVDATRIEQVAGAIEEIPYISEVAYGGSSTNKVVEILEAIRDSGNFFVVALAIVAFFMIFNTIKMTIGTREDEIAIMRMVGASNWYIRMPLLFEGILIGLLGALIPVIVLMNGYGIVYDTMNSVLNTTMIALVPPLPFTWQLSVILLAVGGGVGLIGSFVSIRRYLKF